MTHEPTSPTRPILLFTLVLSLFSLAVNIPVRLSANTSGLSTPDRPYEDKDKKKDDNKDKPKKNTDDSTSTKLPSSAPDRIGQPAIWQDRGDISTLDLYLGEGSPQGMPKPPFQFKEEDKSGTNPKIKVIDANGVKWNVKFDEEVHAEIAASRLVWAFGYMVEESYFVPSGQVNGVKGLHRAKKFVAANGAFTNGRFEKRPKDIARRKQPWSWSSNPFTGTKEMSGLILLNVLLNNWDAKEDNNDILGMYDKNGGINEWYTVCDWGGTFGKAGSAFSHSKWDPHAFSKQPFVDGVNGNTVKLHYTGKMNGSHSVPLDHARWFAGLAGRLTDDQIRQAFKAAGATPAETESFASQLRRKINELKTATER